MWPRRAKNAVEALGCLIRGGRLFSVGSQISSPWGDSMGCLYRAPQDLAALYGRQEAPLRGASASRGAISSCSIASSSPRSKFPI